MTEQQIFGTDLMLSRYLVSALIVLVGAFVLYGAGRALLGRAGSPVSSATDEARARSRGARRTLNRIWAGVVVVLALLAYPVAVKAATAPGGPLPGVAVAAFVLVAFAVFVPALLGRSLLPDVATGLAIRLEGQFVPGDRVQLSGADVQGVVESASLRVTVIRESDGSRVFVPNASITAVRALSAAAAEGDDGRGRGRGRTRRPRSRRPEAGDKPTEAPAKTSETPAEAAPRTRRDRPAPVSGEDVFETRPSEQGEDRGPRSGAGRSGGGGSRRRGSRGGRPRTSGAPRETGEPERADNGAPRETSEARPQAPSPSESDAPSDSPWSIE